MIIDGGHRSPSFDHGARAVAFFALYERRAHRCVRRFAPA
jgi:hypothetical protein